MLRCALNAAISRGVSTLVNDELIDIGFPKIRARSINRNNSSIPRFTKVGHEPWNSKIYKRRESSDIPETTRTPLTSHTKMRLRNQHTERSHHARFNEQPERVTTRGQDETCVARD